MGKGLMAQNPEHSNNGHPSKGFLANKVTMGDLSTRNSEPRVPDQHRKSCGGRVPATQVGNRQPCISGRISFKCRSWGSIVLLHNRPGTSQSPACGRNSVLFCQQGQSLKGKK